MRDMTDRAEADAALAPAMGSRAYFPDQRAERRREFVSLTPGERVVQAIELSRSATAIAAAAARSREAPRSRD